MSYRLGKNIVATVTYYDVMDFPLTAFEIWKHLLEHNRDNHLLTEAVTLGAVWRVLLSGQLASKIVEKNGFYFL
ncbi:MAG: hypothetical protein Q8O53_01365, partial [Candidatus Moranbacteria bacterium]|nr:hypothetical protein [Candidatus Moranbacteria bacterium]